MSFLNYMKEKIGALLILVFAIFSIEVFLLLYDVGFFIKWYIPICILLTFFAMSIVEYRKKKHFYETILQELNRLDQKYLINELIPTPSFTEGKILKEILEDANKSMIEHVNNYKHANQEYREYIELWIHEVKTPIATSKMIIENHPNEVTRSMEEEIEKIDAYVEQSLFYARSNTLEKDYLIKQVELDRVINKVLLKHRKLLTDRAIQIEFESTDKKVYSDIKWLEFILTQILSNSIKYCLNPNPKIRYYLIEQKNMITLSIQDNGIGIEKSELSKVFEKGFTGKNGRIGNKSTGIGLYLCKKLCDKLGHAITIHSVKEEGTTVKITFPIGSFHHLTEM